MIFLKKQNCQILSLVQTRISVKHKICFIVILHLDIARKI
jgi:hypothetical protein